MSEDMKLTDLREKIDSIDSDLLRLFQERMDIVSQVAEHKKVSSLPVMDQQREAQILKWISQNAKPEHESQARILYDMIFELSRSHQRLSLRQGASELNQKIKTAIQTTPPLFPEQATVACQGVMGAYAEWAAKRLFKQPNIQYLKTYDAVFSAVENGFCKYGVLPLENSTAGSVNKVYSLMNEREFYIVRSLRLKVDHNLAAPEGVKIKDIREVISHEQALAQCAGYLEKLGSNIKLTQCENTATAAEMVAASGRSDIAAICSRECTRLYGLECLDSDIQDRMNNYTRFICISKNLEIYPGADRTSIMMTLPHVPGSLYKALGRFYALGVNLDKLESRPLPERDFDFMFYLTLVTSVYSDSFAKIMDEVQEFCVDFEYLGSYSEVI